MSHVLIRYFFLFALTSPTVFAETLLLRVEVVEQEPTDFHPPCESAEESNVCIPWSLWTIYHSRVKQIINGTFELSEIEVAVLQHANFMPEAVKDIYLIVDEFSNQETINQLGTKYYSKGPIGAVQVVCLPKSFVKNQRENEKFTTPRFESSEFDEYCFIKESIDAQDDEP